jgi:Domain of unknown function DUF1828
MSAMAQSHANERITRLTLQRIMHDFGELLAVTALDEHSFKVTTPFTFANGEIFPIVIETHETGWRITDRGNTLASCVRDTAELTEHHINKVTEIVRANGFTLSDSHHIYADYGDLPTPIQLARVIQVEAAIGNLLHDSRLQSDSK